MLGALPNVITCLRLAVVPAAVWFSFGRDARTLGLAAGLFTLAAFSDWLDGYLARRMGSISRLGTLLDPLVDKCLVLGVLFAMAARGLFPLWLVLLNVVRELLVTFGRHRLSTPGAPLGANWMGKAKFCLQVAVVELCYLQLVLESLGAALAAGRAFVFWSAVAMTAVSYAFLARFFWLHRSRLFGMRGRGASAG